MPINSVVRRRVVVTLLVFLGVGAWSFFVAAATASRAPALNYGSELSSRINSTRARTDDIEERLNQLNGLVREFGKASTHWNQSDASELSELEEQVTSLRSDVAGLKALVTGSIAGTHGDIGEIRRDVAELKRRASYEDLKGR